MRDFMQLQIEASERLYKMMMEDHKERTKDMVLWGEINVGLMKKLDERDVEIKRLKEEITILKAAK
jgi:hypothetical protein